ncbi:MAG: hypothetical protein IPP72_15920 [Chitinophagaceae bacterium]|nr:hypothetical protein [Chitinophagaceae bacterium]
MMAGRGNNDCGQDKKNIIVKNKDAGYLKQRLIDRCTYLACLRPSDQFLFTSFIKTYTQKSQLIPTGKVTENFIELTGT